MQDEFFLLLLCSDLFYEQTNKRTNERTNARRKDFSRLFSCLIIDARNISIPPIEKCICVTRDQARRIHSTTSSSFSCVSHAQIFESLYLSRSVTCASSYVRSFAYTLPNRIWHGSIRTISMRNDVRSNIVLNKQRQRRRRRRRRRTSSSYNHFDTFRPIDLDNSMINDGTEIDRVDVSSNSSFSSTMNSVHLS